MNEFEFINLIILLSSKSSYDLNYLCLFSINWYIYCNYIYMMRTKTQEKKMQKQKSNRLTTISEYVYNMNYDIILTNIFMLYIIPYIIHLFGWSDTTRPFEGVSVNTLKKNFHVERMLLQWSVVWISWNLMEFLRSTRGDIQHKKKQSNTTKDFLQLY